MSGEAIKLRIHLGMDIAKYNSPLNTTGGIGGGGGLGGHKFKSGKAAKRMDRLAPNSVHVCSSLGDFRGSTIQKPGKCGQTAGPIGNTFCTYNAGESGNGHRLNKLAP